MPFYEYQCSHCGHLFEAMQKFSDAPLRKCPACGKSTLKKLMSAPVFRLKGKGWYETDFKSDQESKRNLAGADHEPPESSSPESKAKPESEPTSKTEAKPPDAGKGDGTPAKPAKPAEVAPSGSTAAAATSGRPVGARSRGASAAPAAARGSGSGRAAARATPRSPVSRPAKRAAPVAKRARSAGGGRARPSRGRR